MVTLKTRRSYLRCDEFILKVLILLFLNCHKNGPMVSEVATSRLNGSGTVRLGGTNPTEPPLLYIRCNAGSSSDVMPDGAARGAASCGGLTAVARRLLSSRHSHRPQRNGENTANVALATKRYNCVHISRGSSFCVTLHR